MRKWRNCTSYTPQSLLRNKKITSASRLKALSKVGTTVFKFQGSFDDIVAGSVFEAYLTDCRKSRFGQTLRGSSSSAGRPGMRARSRRTVCDRARLGLAGSTGTKKVSQIVPNCTVSLGSSQGTNPRTGGHSKRKSPLTEVFP